MRTGIFFLILQSLLLCAVVQAEPGATKASHVDFAVAFQPVDTGNGVFADDSGDEEDSQNSADSAVRLFAPAAPNLFPVRHVPQTRRREGHGIRAPPLTA